MQLCSLYMLSLDLSVFSNEIDIEISTSYIVIEALPSSIHHCDVKCYEKYFVFAQWIVQLLFLVFLSLISNFATSFFTTMLTSIFCLLYDQKSHLSHIYKNCELIPFLLQSITIFICAHLKSLFHQQTREQFPCRGNVQVPIYNVFEHWPPFQKSIPLNRNNVQILP